MYHIPKRHLRYLQNIVRNGIKEARFQGRHWLQVVDVDQVIPIRLQPVGSTYGDILVPEGGLKEATDKVIEMLVFDEWLAIREDDDANRD